MCSNYLCLAAAPGAVKRGSVEQGVVDIFRDVQNGDLCHWREADTQAVVHCSSGE